MKTDWDQIRQLLNTAVDVCETIDALDITESDRPRTLTVNGHPVSIYDYLTSAWTYPENLRTNIIRARHAQDGDQSYQPETARILQNVAAVCAEFIGAADTHTRVVGSNPFSPQEAKSLTEMLDSLNQWYQDNMVRDLTNLMQQQP